MRVATPLSAIAAILLLAGAAQAQEISVAIGGDLTQAADELGRREVDRQVEALHREVTEALARKGGFEGARVHLVLTDLQPNRPTMEQASRRPGLSMIDSRSIGGATIEGELVLADGSRRPLAYDWYSTSIADVYGYTTWQDANRAFTGFARRLADNRL